MCVRFVLSVHCFVCALCVAVWCGVLSLLFCFVLFCFVAMVVVLSVVFAIFVRGIDLCVCVCDFACVFVPC